MSDMKKLLFLFVGFVVLASCNSPKTQKVYITFPVEQWVMDYVKKHPNCMNNEITKKQTNYDLIKAVDDSTHKNWLEGIPVKLKTINKVNDKYIALFGLDYAYGLTYKAPLSDVKFDIITEVPESLVPQLKKDEVYTLKDVRTIYRTKISWEADNLLGAENSYDISYSSFDVSLEPDEYETTPDFTTNCLTANLGVYYCDVKFIKIFTERKSTIVSIK